MSKLLHLPRAATLLALTLLPGALQAQQATLEGMVRDVTAGSPIQGAEIRVLGTNAVAITDGDGRYRLAFAGAAGAQVAAFRMGYEELRLPLPLTAAPAAGGEFRLDFDLVPAPIEIGEISVVARKERALARVPGSAEIVTATQLLKQVPLSGNEVLRSVPGIHIQEEEGLGLRLNAGIRGLDPDRSRNLLILEDGVPVALNPYGEPEMYYTPPVDRMERVEVVKGSGSIMFGPRTVGGVINFRTPAPPLEPTGRLSVSGGQGGFRRILGSYGGTWNQVGAYVSVLNRAANDIRGHHFDVFDVTGKIGFAPTRRSEMGVKLSVYDETSNSTYVGLTEAMFAANPAQHPAPDDRLRVRRMSVTGTHTLRLRDGLTLRTAAYAYATTRNWQRQDYQYANGGSEVLLLAGTGHRNRSFEVLGVEPRLQWNHALFGIPGELDAGARFLAERAEETYLQGSTGTSRSGSLRDHELRGGEAASAFVQNRFVLGTFTLVPGIRVESFGFERNVLRTRVRRVNPQTGAVTRNPEDVDIVSGDDVFAVVPGIGATWAADGRLTVFAGVHRGFAPPRTKDALRYDDVTVAIGQAPGEIVSLQLDAERSVNAELGARANPWAGVNVEATAFLLDFSNQIIAASASAGSVADLVTANQGETRHQGLEAAADVNFGRVLGWPFGLTATVKQTWVRSEFAADRFMRPIAGSALVNVKGNRLPYAPESTTALALSFDHPRGFGLRVDGTQVAEQYADNFETRDATPNGRIGLIPAHGVWNVSGFWDTQVRGATLFFTVKNVFDRTYITSRRPEGIRPSTPRLLQLGVRSTF
jgi:Fe(3+) dicitrate transport protein